MSNQMEQDKAVCSKCREPIERVAKTENQWRHLEVYELDGRELPRNWDRMEKLGCFNNAYPADARSRVEAESSEEASAEPAVSAEGTRFPVTAHEWLEDALGRYQVTHIHSSIREAIKAMDKTEAHSGDIE